LCSALTASRDGGSPAGVRAAEGQDRTSLWRLNAFDFVPYSPYSYLMRKLQHKGAEQARNQLPALLAEAEQGRATIITRHGRSIAALVPIQGLAGSRQKSLTALAGSGKGMWGRNSAGTVRRLRDEWSR
jgi:prevent-host-death family protein